MQFHENLLFHIYNQGNNKRKIFFSDENYLFFLWKMRTYLLPFGDLIAWCLMPNHYHWQFYVRQVQLSRIDFFKQVDNVEWKRRVQKYGSKAKSVNREWSRGNQENKMIDLNEAIGILQRSYCRAINKENGWTGSLFKEPYQAKDGWIEEFVTVANNGKSEFGFTRGGDYGYQCFCYIHNNPVEANIVKNSIDYNWSSAKDYAGLRNGNLCNLMIGKQLLESL